MAGVFPQDYAATLTALTVTNLHSLASSQAGTEGWGSALITNSSRLDPDIKIGFTFTTHASNRQAGAINIYIVEALDDTPTFPATASGTAGTEGAITWVDLEEFNAAAKLIAPPIVVDTSASSVVSHVVTSLAAVLGRVPRDFFIYITQNCTTTTTAGLAASGNSIKITPYIDSYT